MNKKGLQKSSSYIICFFCQNLARLENNDINNKSALVKHVYSENHHMHWNNSKILAKKTNYIRRRFLESFFIHFNNDAFNEKTNCFYPTAYYNLNFKSARCRFTSQMYF